MKIVRVMCSIQEGSLGQKNIKQLESMIRSTYRKYLGTKYKLLFMWMKVPFQQSYLAGKISTASTVQFGVVDGMANKERHALMADICAKWQEITGCNKNEIILTAPDMSEVKAFHKAMMSRIHPKLRSKTQKRILLRMTKGYLRDGYMNTTVNI